jgi:enoyl-CoA hydratase
MLLAPAATREIMSVRTESNGRVLTVIIDRPEVRNAVDGPTAHALAGAFREFEGSDAFDVAVLTGAGETFCAGADLKAFAQGNAAKGNLLDADLAAVAPMGPTRMRLSKPVIAAVAGYAVAGGMELALWCDLRVMEETATFGIFCRRWGVPLIDGGTLRLPRLIGMGRALDLVLTGRPVDAREALAIGLASRVVPHGQARAAAEQLASEIARFPQTCLRSDRRSAYEQWALDVDEALGNEFRLGMATLASGETSAGLSRFAAGEGRHGSFGGASRQAGDFRDRPGVGDAGVPA